MAKKRASKKAEEAAARSKKTLKELTLAEEKQWSNQFLGMSDKGEFVCRKCDETFPDIEKLFGHAKKKHSVSKSSFDLCTTIKSDASEITDLELQYVKLAPNGTHFICRECNIRRVEMKARFASNHFIRGR